jgi:hypothetical protein
MSQILQTVYASAPSDQIIHHTLELQHPSFPNGSLRWVQGFENEMLGLENNGGVVQFTAMGFGVSLPKRSVRGNQDIQFQIDNVTGEALQYLNDALDVGGKIPVIYRAYLSSDKSQPAETPIVMTATNMGADYNSVQVIADFHDFLNKAWPSKRYTPQFAPGLKYL